MTDQWVLSLDIGTSSVKAVGYYTNGEAIAGLASSVAHEPITTATGGSEFPAKVLADRCLAVLRRALDLAADRAAPVAVAMSSFWHSLVGIGANGQACTPVYLWADTRSADYVATLCARLPPNTLHALTGCFPHTSYLPARLIWLQATQPDIVATVRHWVSFPDYLCATLFGKLATSYSLAAGSGLFNPNTLSWEPAVCTATGIAQSALPPIVTDEITYYGLCPDYRQLLPELAETPWFPAIGDGAASNIGSGCACRERMALMVGTSGAMRCVMEAGQFSPPPGLWCYRLDGKRFVVGGALSNGGNLFAWMQDTLKLPMPEELEQLLATAEPDSHGLTILPLLAGERSPGWASHATGAMVGLRLHTTPVQIAQAALEAVCLRFAYLHKQLRLLAPAACQVVATGGALLRSPAWTQMMADALGVPVQASLEAEASCRGAALLALERMGLLPGITGATTRIGATYQPRPAYTEAYRLAGQRQFELYQMLVATTQPASSDQLPTKAQDPPCRLATEQSRVNHTR